MTPLLLRGCGTRPCHVVCHWPIPWFPLALPPHTSVVIFFSYVTLLPAFSVLHRLLVVPVSSIANVRVRVRGMGCGAGEGFVLAGGEGGGAAVGPWGDRGRGGFHPEHWRHRAKVASCHCSTPPTSWAGVCVGRVAYSLIEHMVLLLSALRVCPSSRHFMVWCAGLVDMQSPCGLVIPA